MYWALVVQPALGADLEFQVECSVNTKPYIFGKSSENQFIWEKDRSIRCVGVGVGRRLEVLLQPAYSQYSGHYIG